MTPAKTPLLDELAAHDERVRAAGQRARELAQTLAEHGQALERLKGERIAAYAASDEKAASALRKQAGDAEALGVELQERRLGADIATRSAQDERGVFIAANHAALVAERAPIAHAAAKMIEAAIAALGEGVQAWQAEATVQVALLRSVAGRDGREIPDLHLAQLARDLRRAIAGGVPVPLPVMAVVEIREEREEQAEDSADIIFERIG